MTGEERTVELLTEIRKVMFLEFIPSIVYFRDIALGTMVGSVL